MAYAWFLTPYKRNTKVTHRVERYCAIDDFSDQILAEGGDWSATEILGDMGLVKVRASDATLSDLDKAPGFARIPNHFLLADTLSDLTTQQKNFLNNKMLGLGYTQDEITEASGGDWGTKSLNDLLAFLCTRKLTPRYDAGTDTIILDGEKQPVRPHTDVALKVL